MPLSREEQALVENLNKERENNQTQLIFLERGYDFDIAIREREKNNLNLKAQTTPLNPVEKARKKQLETEIKNLQKQNVDSKQRAEAATFWQRFNLQQATEKTLEKSSARLEKIKAEKNLVQNSRVIDSTMSDLNLKMDMRNVLINVTMAENIEDASQSITSQNIANVTEGLRRSINKLITKLNFDPLFDTADHLKPGIAATLVADDSHQKTISTFLEANKEKRFYSPAHFELINALEIYLEDLEKIRTNNELNPAQKEQQITVAIEELRSKERAAANYDFQHLAEGIYNEAYRETLERQLAPLFVAKDDLMQAGAPLTDIADELENDGELTPIFNDIESSVIQTYVTSQQKQNNDLVVKAEQEITNIKKFSRDMDLQYQFAQQARQREESPPTYGSNVATGTQGEFSTEKITNLATNNAITLHYDSEGQLAQVVLPLSKGEKRLSDLKCLFDYLDAKGIRINADWQVFINGKKDKSYSFAALKEMVRRNTADYNLKTPKQSRTEDLAKERSKIKTQIGQIKKEAVKENFNATKKVLEKADEDAKKQAPAGTKPSKILEDVEKKFTPGKR